jgi:hypothetical protein
MFLRGFAARRSGTGRAFALIAPAGSAPPWAVTPLP